MHIHSGIMPAVTPGGIIPINDGYPKVIIGRMGKQQQSVHHGPYISVHNYNIFSYNHAISLNYVSSLPKLRIILGNLRDTVTKSIEK